MADGTVAYDTNSREWWATLRGDRRGPFENQIAADTALYQWQTEPPEYRRVPAAADDVSYIKRRMAEIEAERPKQ